MRVHVYLMVCSAAVFLHFTAARADTIYFNDFGQTVGTEWSSQATDVTPVGARQYLGPFASESVTLALHDLPPHRSVRISFDLFVIGTWDGSDNIRPGEGPDLWTLRADEDLPLLRTSFDNHYAPLYVRPARQSYPQAYGRGQHAAQTGAEEKNTLGYRDPDYPELPQDAVYHMSFTFAHNADDLSLSFSANCIVGAGEVMGESWGLDDVIVELVELEGSVLLLASSSEGGSIKTPGQGEFWIAQGQTIPIEATADPGYVFDHWVGTAVEQGFIAAPSSAHTILQANAASTLMARFVRDPGTSVLVVDDAATADPGPGDPTVSDPDESGTLQHPFDSIQEAIDVFDSRQHRAVLVLSGLYRGPGNRDIDFKGKRIRLYSSDGPQACVIDCEGQGRGFLFNANEGAGTVIDGFTVRSGAADEGGAVYCEAAPIFSDCIFLDNTANVHGGAIYSSSGELSLVDCVIHTCGEEAVYLDQGAAIHLGGSVRVDSTALVGKGQINVPISAVLEMDHCTISCNLAGVGWINAIGVLTLTGMAALDLAQDDVMSPQIGGTLSCQGLLHVQNQAAISYANIEMSNCQLSDSSVLSDSVVNLDVPLVYGQFLLKDGASLKNNLIKAQSDNFLTFDATFGGVLSGNSVELSLSGEQVLEVRGSGLACVSAGVQTGIVSSVFDRSLWQLRVLELTAGTLVTLTDRFDDQRDGQTESLYVKTLRLGPNAELDCRNLCIQAEVPEVDATATVTFVPLYGQSLGMLDFSDWAEYIARVQVSDSQAVELAREAMKLSLQARGPTLAKGHFDRCLEGRVLIRFRYLFASPEVELRVYLTDSPNLGDRDPEHAHLVGTLVPPPSGRRGSVGSTHFAEAELWADTGDLDLGDGTWVELELIGRAESVQVATHSLLTSTAIESEEDSALIDDWAVEIHCAGVCMDLNHSNTIDEKDFELVLCAVGRSVSGENATARCFEGVFSVDGAVDSMDLCSWEWMLNCDDCMNVCGGESILLTASTTDGIVQSNAYRSNPLPLARSTVAELPEGLIVLDKLYAVSPPMRLARFSDRLHVAQADGTWNTYWLESHLSRGTLRLIPSNTSSVCIINCSKGIADRSGIPLVTPQVMSITTEPRYGQEGAVAIGVQGQGADIWGRPILDAVLKDDAIYVAPVVVNPEGLTPYLAAAKMSPGGDRIELLYDDPNQYVTHSETQDNPNLIGLREIEVDGDGNLYALNVHLLNKSTMLWKYSPTGEVLCRRELDEIGLSDPVGLCVAHGPGGLVYVASGLYDSNDPGATRLYGLSPDDLEVERSIRIAGLHHVTGITEQGHTGKLWVVGYSLDWIPTRLDPDDLPGYSPSIVRIEPNDTEVADLIALEGDMMLPMSIVWIEPRSPF